MAERAAAPSGAWHYGLHPHAAGLRVVSLARVVLPLGEAVRLELAGPDTADAEAPDAEIHVQYVIDTPAGAWALWLSCSRAELPAHEAGVREIVPVGTGEPQDQPPTFHPSRALFAGPGEG